MTISNGYATLADFKAEVLPDAGTDANDDAVIEDIIEAVSRYIDDQTGRRFYASANDETRYFTADDEDELYTGDLVSVTTLSVDAGARTYPYTIASTGYDLAPYNAALDGTPYNCIEINILTTAYFPVGMTKGVKVVGKFGWATAPADIKEICISIGKNIYNRRSGQGTDGVATVTASGVVITPKDISAFARGVIEGKRRYT
jgi:hypothetical protein